MLQASMAQACKGQQKCDFPEFRRRFFGDPLFLGVDSSVHRLAGTSSPLRRSDTCPSVASPSLSVSQQQQHGDASKTDVKPAYREDKPRQLTLGLDLGALQRDDGPPSESIARRQKYLFFEKQCSEVSEGIFVAGDTVAKNRELLASHGVSHVVNCVGFICKEYFKNELEYMTLFLQDTPAEDILCVMYDTFKFMDDALRNGGKVLVHCSQGVSRSATLAMGYLMWRDNQMYDEVFARVKSIRGIVNPNIGFTCQLLQWQKRRSKLPSSVRMYRLAPHCSHASLYLVPKAVVPPKLYPNITYRELDPRGAFIVHTPHKLYIWRGSRCPVEFARAAERQAGLLVQYECAPGPAIVLDQGGEPPDFRLLVDPPLMTRDQMQHRATHRLEASGEFGLSSSVYSATDSADLMECSPALPSISGGKAGERQLSNLSQAGCSSFGVSTLEPSKPAAIERSCFEKGRFARQSSDSDLSSMDDRVGALGWGIAAHSSRAASPELSRQGSGSMAGSPGVSRQVSARSRGGGAAPASQLGAPAGPFASLSFNSNDSIPSLRARPSHDRSRPVSGSPADSGGAASAPSSSRGHWCVAENDEYSADYDLWFDAVQALHIENRLLNTEMRVHSDEMGWGSALPPGLASGSNGDEDMGTCDVPRLVATTSVQAQQDSPASGEGRSSAKKYRRSASVNSERAIAMLEKSKRQWPSLHTSIDEEDLLERQMDVGA